jgi:hypothetical protein
MTRRRKKPTKRKQRYSTRRRRTCKTVCTVCGNAYPKGMMTAAKYVSHVKKFHTAKVYC